MRRDRLPQGGPEGGAGWEHCESNCRRQPEGRDERKRASQHSGAKRRSGPLVVSRKRRRWTTVMSKSGHLDADAADAVLRSLWKPTNSDSEGQSPGIIPALASGQGNGRSRGSGLKARLMSLRPDRIFEHRDANEPGFQPWGAALIEIPGRRPGLGWTAPSARARRGKKGPPHNPPGFPVCHGPRARAF